MAIRVHSWDEKVRSTSPLSTKERSCWSRIILIPRVIFGFRRGEIRN
jgi:hypothetical protein